MVFSRTFHRDEEKYSHNQYKDMEEALIESRRLLDELYRPLENRDAKIRLSKKGRMFLVDSRGGTIRGLPNFHQALHIRDNAEYYGSNLITSCSIGELVHKLWKQLVPHTNYYELDREFCK